MALPLKQTSDAPDLIHLLLAPTLVQISSNIFHKVLWSLVTTKDLSERSSSCNFSKFWCLTRLNPEWCASRLKTPEEILSPTLHAGRRALNYPLPNSRKFTASLFLWQVSILVLAWKMFLSFTVSHILKMPLTVWPQKSQPFCNSVGRTKQIVFALISKTHTSFI